MRIAPFLLLFATTSALAQSVDFEVTGRFDLPSYDYGFDGHGVLADLDRDGRLDVVLDGGFDTTQGSSSTLVVVDPDAGFSIVDQHPFREFMIALAAVQPPSGLPDTVVTLTIDRELTLWQGVPLAPAARFRVPVSLASDVIRAGNVDGDAALELVFCSDEVGVQVFDVASRRTATYEAQFGCRDAELVQADADTAFEIAVVPRAWQQQPARVIDGGSGAVIAAGTHPTGPHLLAGNLDGDAFTELVTTPSAERAGYLVVDVAPAWSERIVAELPGAPSENQLDTLTDRNLDGVADAVARRDADGALSTIELASGAASRTVLERACTRLMLTGDLAPQAGAELVCPTSDFLRYEVDASLRLYTLGGTRLAALATVGGALAPPTLADFDGDGVAELLTSVTNYDSIGAVLVIDPDTMQTVYRQSVPALQEDTAPPAVVAVQADADPRRELFLANMLLDADSGAPIWTADLQPERVVATNVDAGTDEIVVLEFDRSNAGCRVVVLDGATGARRWTSADWGFRLPDEQPALLVAQSGSGPVVVAACADELYAFRATDGTRLWQGEGRDVTDLDAIGTEENTEVVVTLLNDGIRHLAIANGTPTRFYDGDGNGLTTTDYRTGVSRIASVDGDLVALDVRTGGTIAALPLDARDGIVARRAADATELFVPTRRGIVRVLASERSAVRMGSGLTGLWYEPGKEGQGVALEFFPTDANGSAQVFGGWFTHDDLDLAGSVGQRWFSLGGRYDPNAIASALTVFRNTGGNFASPPMTTAAVWGSASLTFDDCNHARLHYDVPDYDQQYMRRDTIDLVRLLPDVTCAAPAAGPAAADFALSGNWFDPATSGQGFVIEVNPRSSLVFLSWYTYATEAQLDEREARQRWYTGQATYVPGTRSMTMPLFATTGTQFDAVPTTQLATAQVGTATLTFADCTHATLTYLFADGTNAGRSGTIGLQRVGPAPAGCAASK